MGKALDVPASRRFVGHEVLRWALNGAEGGLRTVLASVLSKTGSVPGKPGARLALQCIDGDEVWRGTVGGAGLEERVKAVMRDLLAGPHRQHGQVLTYGLTSGAKGFEVQPLDSLCGGRVTVTVEVLEPTPHLLLMGGGHCAVALAELSHHLGWRTSVQDSRQGFVAPEHHPHAIERHVGSVEEFLGRETAASLARFSDILLLGHDHAEDRARLHGLLKTMVEANRRPGENGAPRIGCIGSRSKWNSFREGAIEAGLPADAVDSVACPIGLNIGAETPQEIAVAVAAAIIAATSGTVAGSPTWRDLAS